MAGDSPTRTEAPRPELLSASPTEFGRYLLHRLIAEGGMAQVFLAEQRAGSGFSKLVALKRILPHLSKQAEFVSMFLDEVRLAAKLSHPNIVQVFDFGEVEGHYFLAMEYLAGEDLATLLSQTRYLEQPIPIPVVLQILIGVCDGLHYAHELRDGGVPQNIVHRDISHSNIVVTYQGGVKVVDFGIARAVNRRSEQTDAGIVKGKFPYCSPEQIEGGKLDQRSDVFSVGIVLHELLSGRRLFRRENDAATCMAVLRAEIPDPSTLRPDVPKELDAIVQKALQRIALDRYQSALEMRRDLERLVSGPPVRLDEYMLKLFDEQRIAERSHPLSGVNVTPTGIETGKQSWSHAPGLKRKESTRKALAPEEGEGGGSGEDRSRMTVAVTPSGVKRRRARRMRTAVTVGAIAAVVLAAGATGWWGLSRRATASEQPGPAAAPRGAALQIDTIPRGAALQVGGRALAEVAPTEVRDLPSGSMLVQATLAGYKPATQVVELQGGERRSVVLTLAAETGALEVAAPEQAAVSIDGADRGRERRFELAPGEHRVRVTLAGHQPFEATAAVSAGATARVQAKLAPSAARPRPAPQPAGAPGTLEVSCIPWCRVFLDGADVGKPSPIVGLPIAAGRHALRMEHPPSGRSKEVELTVKPGEAVRQVASFR